MNHRAARSPAAHRHQHRVQHEFAADRGAGRPADNLAREQIHDHRKVQPSLPGSNEGDVRHPTGVGTRHGELALQEIGDQDRRLADRPSTGAIAVPRAHVIHTHQSSHAMLAAGLSGLAKIEEHARRTVDAVAGRERPTDQTKQPSILLRSVRDRVE
jgi:hypothetical protein